MDRSSGILLPVSALPGPCGIGDLGKDARDFIDFLAAAGQRYWQILPLNPPDGAHSPYLSASTFAGSTDLLSPEPFVARGALTADEVRAIDWGSDPMRVDYARVHAGRTALWDAAFARERDAVVPALRAALAVHVDTAEHHLSTEWFIRYVGEDGEVRSSHALPDLSAAAEGRIEDGTAGRDIDGETRLAREVLNHLLPLAGRHPALWQPLDLRGMATARFMTETLPVLRELEAFDIEVDDDVPDELAGARYRVADGEVARG